MSVWVFFLEHFKETDFHGQTIWHVWKQQLFWACKSVFLIKFQLKLMRCEMSYFMNEPQQQQRESLRFAFAIDALKFKHSCSKNTLCDDCILTSWKKMFK